MSFDKDGTQLGLASPRPAQEIERVSFGDLRIEMTEPELLFSEDEWDSAMPALVKDITAYLSRRRAPVFKDQGDHGEGWGSGAFLRLGKQVFVLTNHHVADARTPTQRLTSQLKGQEDIWVIVGNHFSFPLPLDLALLPVPEKIWQTQHDSTAIAVSEIALAHDPVKGELLAFSGFAGDRVNFHFGTLCSEASCYTAREVSLPFDDRFVPRFHFGIDYRPDLAQAVIGDRGPPLPPGLSGSVVWDTQFVAARMRKLTWKPEMARVTGIVWGWPSDRGCIVATRAEYLRSFLLNAAQSLAYL